MNSNQQLINVLNDAADKIVHEGWTNLDYENRNPSDGHDIISAVSEASKDLNQNVRLDIMIAALHEVTDQLIKHVGTQADEGMYLELLNSPYPAAALVHWQTEDGTKWSSITLIEQAIDHLENTATWTSPEEYNDELAAHTVDAESNK